MGIVSRKLNTNARNAFCIVLSLLLVFGAMPIGLVRDVKAETSIHPVQKLILEVMDLGNTEKESFKDDVLDKVNGTEEEFNAAVSKAGELLLDLNVETIEAALNLYKGYNDDKRNAVKAAIDLDLVILEGETNFDSIAGVINEEVTGDANDEKGLRFLLTILNYVSEILDSPIAFDGSSEGEIIFKADTSEILNDTLFKIINSVDTIKNKVEKSPGTNYFDKLGNYVAEIVNDQAKDEVTAFKEFLKDNGELYGEGYKNLKVKVPESKEQGEEIIAAIEIDNLKGIAGMQFTITYDRDVFETYNSSVERNSKLKDVYFEKNVIQSAGEIRVAFIAENGEAFTEEVSATICTIGFDIKSNATPGTYGIKVKDIIASDAADNPAKVPVTAVNGDIKITSKPKPTPKPTPTPSPGRRPGRGTGGYTVGSGTDDDTTPTLPTNYIDKEYAAKVYIENNTKSTAEVAFTIKDVHISGSNAEISISNDVLQKAIETAVNKATELENSIRASGIDIKGRRIVNIDIPVADMTNNLSVNIPADVLNKARENEIYRLGMSTNYASVAMTPDALGTSLQPGAQNVDVVIKKISPNTLPANTAPVVGKKPVVEFDILVDGNRVPVFNSNKAVEVSIDYSIYPGENTDKLVAYRINDDGTLTAVKSSLYDSDEGKLVFTTDVPGKYTVLESGVSFVDIATVPWAKTYIEALAGRDIIAGMGDSIFEPNRNIKREEFAKMLVVAFGFDNISATTDMVDVPHDAWYHQYVAIAEQLGIVKGIGNNQFGVGSNITRQDMATMAFRAATVANRRIKRVQHPQTFADNVNIADYAKDSITWMQQANIITGVGDNLFAPVDNATRAQASKIIYMLFKAR